jgi:hypothetical protein
MEVLANENNHIIYKSWNFIHLDMNGSYTNIKDSKICPLHVQISIPGDGWHW